VEHKVEIVARTRSGPAGDGGVGRRASGPVFGLFPRSFAHSLAQIVHNDE
jgi:hypothetical protein